ncbi:MAG TPA: hypothetical protein VFB12_09150 [Ktedonobacteraceae bacterium]|nr:hypothetical protein [Ktedonobacteraceae bacterium]
MTREFNKQRRNDSRPSFRNQSSSGRYEEKQEPRTDRPRLNRETVDRAWEKGAPRLYADYRPRGDNRQASSKNWRNQQRPDSSNSNDSGGHRRYNDNSRGHYRGNAQNGERGNQHSSSRSYDSERHHYDNQRSRTYNNNYRGHTDETYHQGGRHGFRDNAQSRDRTPRFPDQERGNRRYDSEREFGRNGRDNGRSPEGRNGSFRNDQRYNRPRSGPENRQGSYDERQDRKRYPRYNERFEGDYEGLGNDEGQYQRGRPTRNRSRDDRQAGHQPYNGHDKVQERHVTRLPDGRVLKGSRPAQRQQAQFWTGVDQEAEQLVHQVHTPASKDEERVTEQLPERVTEQLQDKKARKAPPKQQAKPDAPERKPAKRVASAARRKTGQTHAQPGAVLKPSQRGFKWPES